MGGRLDHRSARTWWEILGMLSVLGVMCSDDQGCRSGTVGRRDRISFSRFFSKVVLLRRVAYSTGLTCTIESTGMCVSLQCTGIVLTSAMTMDFSAIACLLELR